MFGQKRKEQVKAYEKQEKRIREMKASGSSKKQAVCISLLFMIHLYYIIIFLILIDDRLQ